MPVVVGMLTWGSMLAMVRAEVVVDTDFGQGDFSKLGWKADGPWDITTYPSDKNNPGPVARFPARKPDGTLTKTFAELKNPGKLALSMDVGWGWGASDHAESAAFMLLDAQGDGYIFQTCRAKANWAVQWATVTNNRPPHDKKWAAAAIDGTQASIRDGGGMERLTLTRDIDGNWTLACKNWNKGAGATVQFTDTTTTHFTKLVLVGSQNQDEPAFNKIVLDAIQGSDYVHHRVTVIAPAYGATIQGDTTITLAAPGFTKTTVKCWKQGKDAGSDSTIGAVTLDEQGRGMVVFPADQYPHGPLTVRLRGDNGTLQDNCYLQLYNQGGVSWNEGMPKDSPPAAEGMKLVFADDFAGPLSISDTDPKATYYDHKPPNGAQDFSSIPFTSFHHPHNPFAQVDTYLRIRASAQSHSAGLISSLKRDGHGVTAQAPCYFECRFLAPNAIGTWPAFWLLTPDQPGDKSADELDIIEAYGGEGPHAPNAKDGYMITPHAWNQSPDIHALAEAAYRQMHNPVSMNKFQIPATWYETFHTYGCKITPTDTTYYCDNIAVGHHPTLPLSRTRPFYFMINLATGGGWPVNLSRYNGQVDMYVDYVRVYTGTPAAP